MLKIVNNIINYILKQRKSFFLFLIVVISLIKCFFTFFITDFISAGSRPIGYFSDSAMYERMSENLLSGHGFSLSPSEPFLPTMYKEPFYSFFIALIKMLPFGNINLVIVMQTLLNPLIAILVLYIGREVFNEKVSRLSCLLVAVIPIYGEVSFFIMPEFVFIILFGFAILCLFKALKLENRILFIISGALLGLASLCRNAIQPLFLVYPLCILFRNRRNITSKLIVNLIIFIFFFLIVTVPWMVRNQQKLGLFSISRRGGELVSHQAFWAANFNRDEWKAYSLYLLSGRLSQRLYPKIIGNDLGAYEYRILMRTDYVNRLLEKFPEGEVEKIILMEGIKDFLHHPFKFILLTSIIYMQTFKYFESISLMLITGKLQFVWLVSMLRFLLFILGLMYALITFFGIMRIRGSFNKIYLILITVVYFHISLTCFGIIPGALQRHIVPISIFYSYFAVVILLMKKDESAFS